MHRPVSGFFARLLRNGTLGLILAYRYLISPLIHTIAGAHSGCRFSPTCSQFATEAFKTLPFRQATWRVVQRLSRCHPFAEAGYDPVHRDIGMS